MSEINSEKEEKSNRWVSLVKAAQHLDESYEGLRRKLNRHAEKGDDGVIEATLGGLRARKFGHVWKVKLGTWG